MIGINNKLYKKTISIILLISMLFSWTGNVAYANELVLPPETFKVSLTANDKQIAHDDKNRIEQGADVGIRYEFNFVQGDYRKELLEKGFEITIPSQLQAQEFILELKTKDAAAVKYGQAEGKGNKIKFTFDDNFINAYSDADVTGWFTLDTKFVASNNSGQETLNFVSGDKTIYSFDVFYNVKKIDPKITTSKEKVTLIDGGQGYKWTTTIEPGNTQKGTLTINNSLKELMIIEDDVTYPVTFDGQKLDKSSYNYTETNSGGSVNAEFTYSIDKFEELDESEKHQLIYYTKINPNLYLKDSSSEIISESNLLKQSGTEGQGVSVSKSNKVTDTITPDIINKAAVLSADKKSLNWIVTINGNNISMYDAQFFLNTDINKDGYLSLRKDSVKISDSSEVVKELTSIPSGYNYGIELGDFSKTKIITFTTDINESFYQQNHQSYNFNVDVMLQWNPRNDGSEGYASKAVWKDKMSQPSGTSSVIEKVFDGYDPSNGIITWKIVLNSNKEDLKNVVMIDRIQDGQDFEGVYTDKAGNNKFVGLSSDGKNITLEQEDKNIIIKFDNLDTEEIIYIKTKLPEEVYHSNKVMNYQNIIEVTADEGVIGTVDKAANPRITNEVLSKTGKYDASAHTIEWTIIVNKNKTDLRDVKLIDDIPASLEYVDNSFSIDNGKSLDKLSYVEASGDSTKSGTITYDFGASVDKTYTVKFKTKITDLSMFYNNGTPVVSNKAVLKYDGDRVQEYNSPDVKVPVSVIQKEALNSSADSKVNVPVINWQVTVNEDHMVIEDGVISDKFTVMAGSTEIKPLSLDATDMELYEYDFVDDVEAAPKRVTITQSMFSYDKDAKSFELKLPKKDRDRAKYVLKYTTKATDTSIRKFEVVNDAEFSCSNDKRTTQKTDKKVFVSFAAGEFSGDYNKKITVTRTDSKDSSVVLKGAIFGIYDSFGNEIDRKTTDNKGKATFEGLTKNVEYTIKEIKAPEGYELDTEPKIVTTSKDMTECKSKQDKLTTQIKFTQFSEAENGDKVTGSQFTLYDEAGREYAKAVSDKDGLVVFDNVEYGKYTIKETTASDDYELSDDVLEVIMRQDEDGRVSVDLSKDFIVNTPKFGSITIFKKDAADKDKYLAGAEFNLIDHNGNIVNTAVSDEDGKIVWDNVPFGTYTINEIKAPVGYVIDGAVLSIRLSDDNSDDIVTITNSLIHATIEFRGVSSKTNSEVVKGAEFAIYDSEDKEFAEPIKTVISDDNGFVRFEEMPVGKYVIKEIKPAAGFKPSDQIITVEVTDEVKTLGETVKPDIYDFKIEPEKEDNIVIDKNDGNISSDVNNDRLEEDQNKPAITDDKKEEIEDVTENNDEQVKDSDITKITEESNENKIIDKVIKIIPKTGSYLGGFGLVCIAITLIAAGGMLMSKKRYRKKH